MMTTVCVLVVAGYLWWLDGLRVIVGNVAFWLFGKNAWRSLRDMTYHELWTNCCENNAYWDARKRKWPRFMRPAVRRLIREARKERNIRTVGK